TSELIPGIWKAPPVVGHVGIVVVKNVLLTGNTVACSQLQVRQCGDVRQKALFAEPPSQCQGGEVTPSVFLTEARRSIRPESSREKVFVFKSVVGPSKERYKEVFTFRERTIGNDQVFPRQTVSLIVVEIGRAHV